MSVSTNDLKNGMTLDLDGVLFQVIEFQHVKPGKGGAFVCSKLRRVDDGAVIDKTFKAGEKFRPVRTGRNFSPARNVLSMTAPSSTRFSFVRTNAPPLPGFTCWKSTILNTLPSTSMCVQFLNWLVEITVAEG